MDPRDGDLWSAVRSFFQPKSPPPPPPPPRADPFSHIFSPPPPPTMVRIDENVSLMDFANASSFGGLEEVCMPFLSQIQQPPTAAGVVGPPTKASDQPKQKRQLGGRSGKKKKEPIKKVVVHAPADTSNCSDNWAWRKYGQKPIKGSPYPRTRNKQSGASSSSRHSPTTPLGTSPTSRSVGEEDKDAAREFRVEEMEVGGVDDDFMFIGNATAPFAASSLGALDDFDDTDPFFSQLWNHNGDGATGGGSK
ncbi:uncharacterized protein A4U43_C06F14250 [Asparagus officinalis]|uniref:WRKY domain-containing protein n=1 Tax=Asparagus officinalis TaxID=4686 RepID=A0A5P1EMV1_ASPOF|nr:uncharacterized protein A4U43_C06F14250 [Asparagus officinalis]